MSKDENVNEKPITVVLIEDEDDIRIQQEKLLKRHKSIKVIGRASNGRDGLKLALKLKPKVLLLDLGLPDISGIQVTQELKEKNPEIEVLIFTTFDEEEKVLAAIKAGAGGYILKGISASRMVDAIKEVAQGGIVIQPHLARHLLQHFRTVLGQKEKREKIVSPLTPRENEILQLIAKGLTNREVASALKVSMATVRTHLEHIYAKMDVTNRTEAVTEGIRKGFIPLD
jgi:DNA-binding NarL/FixJ family response regulator